MLIDGKRQEEAKIQARKTILEAELARQERRISQGAAEFADGNFAVLQNNELVARLADYIHSLFAEGRREEASTMMGRLGECVRCGDIVLRQRAVMALSVLIDRCLERRQLPALGITAGLLAGWLELETVYIAGFEVVCNQIRQLVRLLLEHGLLAETEPLLAVIHRIRCGSLQKGNVITGMMARLQENLASIAILELLASIFLSNEGRQQESAGKILVCLGRRAVIFLINQLMHSDSKQDRLLLMRLIPDTGHEAAPVLVECLNRNPPWFVVRNIVAIVAGIGDPLLYPIVEPYLQHRDIRVQQEVVGCIVGLGGGNLKTRLIEALAAVDDRLKPALVVQLAEIGGKGAAGTLVRLLDRRDGFSMKVREELVVRIVLALRQFADKDSVAAIERLVEEQADAPWSERIIPLAEEALCVIEPKLRHERQKLAAMHEETTFADDPREKVKAASLIRSFEEEIAALIRKGDLDIACGKIFSRCVTAARDKDFITAEKLRDRLLQINPMALDDVLRAGEIIEEERSTSITGHHLTIWADLHERMSTAEFTALYQAMRPERYRTGESIVRRGETDPCLYFINSGSVGTYCHDGAQEIFLKRMQPGDILGVDQFFSASVWTITSKALSDVRIQVLDRQALADLQPFHAEIEPKLHDCCRKFDIVPELVRMAGSDRRDHSRFRLSMIIDVMLLDRYGHPGKGTFTGEMTDVSRGGIAVAIRMPNRNSAGSLLGRQVVTELGPVEGRMLQCTGMIVGVTSRIAAGQDLVIHIKLFNKLEQTVVTEIVSVAHRTAGR